MKPAPFEYHRPASLLETFDLLERYGDDGRVLAGGQSLVPALNMRLATPRAVIDINRLPGLDGIRLAPEGLVIGALARHESVERSPLVREHAPLLGMAMPHVGHEAIRTRGTVGGSLALADPAAELPACCIALDAAVIARNAADERRIPAAQFFTGLYTTALRPYELIAAVEFPVAKAGERAVILELARRSGDYAMAGIAAKARLAGATLVDPQIVFFGLGERPVLAQAAMAAISGQQVLAGTIAAAQAALATDLDPPADQHGSPQTKRHLAGVLLARALKRMAGIEDARAA